MEDGTDTITTTSGSITLDGVGGTGGSNDYGIKTTSEFWQQISSTTTETGNITLEANTWSLATADLAIQTTGGGSVYIQPTSQNGTIGVRKRRHRQPGRHQRPISGIITAPNTIIGLSNGTGLIASTAHEPEFRHVRQPAIHQRLGQYPVRRRRDGADAGL